MQPEKFRRDLARGNGGQEQIRLALIAAGCETLVRDSHGGQDLTSHVQGNWWQIEVKTELGYQNSENICVETEQNAGGWNGRHGPYRKWAGLYASESQIWVHIFGSECVVFRANQMRWWLHQNEREDWLKEMEFGKSDNGNRGFLVKKIRLSGLPWVEFLPIGRLSNSKVFQSDAGRIQHP